MCEVAVTENCMRCIVFFLCPSLPLSFSCFLYLEIMLHSCHKKITSWWMYTSLVIKTLTGVFCKTWITPDFKMTCSHFFFFYCFMLNISIFKGCGHTVVYDVNAANIQIEVMETHLIRLICLFLNDFLWIVSEAALLFSVTLKNAAELLEFAAMYNAEQLKLSCLQFIVLNMAALLESKWELRIKNLMCSGRSL